MSTIRITKQFNFETGHALYGYDGKCKNVHGHSYKLSVTVIGKPIEDTSNVKYGMVIDFGDLAIKEFDELAAGLALLPALSMCVMAARAHDLVVIDGVYGALQDVAGFESEALQGKGLGFDGKSLIHPAQIEPANRIFSPSEAELAEALALIAAFEAPENAGKGVLSVNGRMAERLHYEIARRVAGLA